MRRLLLIVALGACTPTPAPDAGSSSVSANTNATSNVVDAGEREPPKPVASASASETPADPPEPEPTFDEYRADPKAKALAQELWTRWRIVSGLEKPYTMDGGYRGMIKIEPAAPINADRQHLEWVVSSFRDFDQFFAELTKYGRDAGVGWAASGVAPGMTSGATASRHTVAAWRGDRIRSSRCGAGERGAEIVSRGTDRRHRSPRSPGWGAAPVFDECGTSHRPPPDPNAVRAVPYACPPSMPCPA